MKSSIQAALIALCAIMVMAGCSQGEYTPEGSAVIKGFYEVDDAGSRSLVIQYAVSNTGLSVIEASTVSFSASTDLRAYYVSGASAVRIVPGYTVYLSAAIVYATAPEIVTPATVLITGAFFE